MNPIQKTNDFAPAITLMFFAPLIAEILPGATRFSALFVYPIEVFVWGGGALLIRYAVRRWRLPWPNMLLLALALAIAEECIIQQTSLAPMVIRLKGETYARAVGINYVYMFWALIYEVVFVVFLPIYLVELLYPTRRERPWISKAGGWTLIPLFILGSFLAWYSWTRIARPKVFHMPIYTPSVIAMVLSFAIIIALILTALKPKPTAPAKALTPPSPTILTIASALWAILLYALTLLAFGIAPHFPPLAAILLGLLLAAIPPLSLPRWQAHVRWQSHHTFAVILGALLGSMAAGFIGFLGSSGPDLYFKVIVNIIAVILLITFAYKINRRILNNTN